ncbi:tyrosine-protein kinase receptor UFO isoform X2 [Rhinichthys klamathensis goyatoka]|uniref:tyrosine-protein kinase receptor UFO isoform X2 n=1 Tax=Rhinichthys klamathensis goyatoka TaxID=3034132 RepID=UPI0024B4D96A|nr:tyrosine-protein kinase receptor UFO isoform X2 [Rhinichthys klamathensis goyatoka]
MNLVFNMLLFLFSILWIVTTAQLTPIREEIFDSSEQSKLQWTFSPTKAWKETQMQLGKDYAHSIYQACNPDFTTNTKTLWTNWIPKQDAQEFLLDLSFAQEDQQPLYIYVQESNQPQKHFRGARRPVLRITVGHPFPADTVPRDEDLSHAKALHLGKISQNGFHLGFSYRGKCTYIASIQVFFMKCPAFAWNQMEFEETVAGGLRRGVCVNGSVEISSPQMECRSNGTWGPPPQGSCVCGAEYKTDGNSCKGRDSFTKPTHDPKADSSPVPKSDSSPVPKADSNPVPKADSRSVPMAGSSPNSKADFIPDPNADSRPGLFSVLTAVPVCGVLFLLIAALFIFVRRHKLSGGQETELISRSGVTRYQRPKQQEHTADPELVNMSGSVQMLEGMSDMLCGLRDVLVERTKLTMCRILGKGEFGAVYEGIFSPQKGQDIRVAVKTSKEPIYSKEDLESFLKEAEIMKHFDHVNVVKLLGVALERDPESSIIVPLVILPFMKHRDLHSFLKATRYGDAPMCLPYQRLLHFMIDIAAGMEYLSLQGFLHRDLAARNCMLGDDLRVCVADFGLSKQIYSSNYYRHKNWTIKLPVRWMAIESVSDNIFTTKSDVWSFGITMWEITSRGKTPYPGVSNYELLDFLEKGHRLTQGDIDSKLYEVMLSCWHRDPSQRPGFGELGQSLKALLSALPPLEASRESHDISLGLEEASGHRDSTEALETEV